MTHLVRAMARLQTVRLSDERGATAVEYGMIVALIAALLTVVLTTLGVDVRTAFETVEGAF